MSDDTSPLKDRIVTLARELCAREGLGAVTFDRLARELSVSKQAIIYWMPTRVALLLAVALPAIRAEAATARAALAAAPPGARAGAEAFLRAVIRFHLEDLARFRLIYLAPQIGRGRPHGAAVAPLLDEVHPVTGAMYEALEARLATAGRVADPRAGAVGLHSAALGLVLMHALADSIGDPLRHDPATLTGALLARVLDGVE